MGIISNTTRKTFNTTSQFPVPGSNEESKMFNEIQQRFCRQFENVFPDKFAPRTVVILPSLTLDQDILSKITGSVHYEERMLCLLMLLRMPLTKIIYVTSVPVADIIIDYYLHLLPGITGSHARRRLTMLSCYDASVKPLAQKVLDRPRLIERIKKEITDTDSAHLTCFNITNLEKTLAVQLGIPLYGTDPDKFYEGSKSGSRRTFRESGVRVPDGFEDLTTKEEIVRALAVLKRRNIGLRKAVVKVNDGFSGDGNAVYTYPPFTVDDELENNIRDSFSAHFKTIGTGVTEELFLEKFGQMGGIVEIFLEGDIKMSPSVQCVINPSKGIEIVSTHDQLLGGNDDQVFMGAVFPADKEYSTAIAEDARKISDLLVKKGILGRYAIDFISVKQADGSWENYAIEINLRKGGTTHPFLMLKFLTDGEYLIDKGEYITAAGNKRFYFASDNVCGEKYKGLTPHDLIDIAMFHELMFDGAAQEGVVFHLLGALSEHGKLGLVCIGSTAERAKDYYDKTIEMLNFECA